MESRLTNNMNRHPIAELSDFLFVPTSLLRGTHTQIQIGKHKIFEHPKYKTSKFVQIIPYLDAYVLESARLYGYYKLGEAVVKHLM